MHTRLVSRPVDAKRARRIGEYDGSYRENASRDQELLLNAAASQQDSLTPNARPKGLGTPKGSNRRNCLANLLQFDAATCSEMKQLCFGEVQHNFTCCGAVLQGSVEVGFRSGGLRHAETVTTRDFPPLKAPN